MRRGDRGEFAVTPTFMKATGAQLGDSFTLLTISSAQAEKLGFDVPEPDGPTIAATLVGVIESHASELADATPLAVFPVSLLDEGDIGISGSVAVADLAPGKTVDDLRAQLNGLKDGDEFSIESAAVVAEDVEVAVATQAQATAVLAAIVALASIVVLTQALSRQVRPTAAEERVLRAVGLRRGQVLLEPVGRAVAPVAIGTVGAAILAILASGVFPTGFARRLEPDPGLRIDGLVHVGGALLFGATLLALVAATRALAGSTSGRAAAPSVYRLATRSPSPQAGLGLRFAFGPRPGTGSVIAPLAGVVAVIGLVVAALTFGANLDRLIANPARYGERYDLGVGVGAGSSPTGLVPALEESPAVGGLAQAMATTVQVDNDALGLIGLDVRKGDLAPEVLEGRLPQAPDELALGSRAARDLAVGVGDVVVVRGRGGAAHELRVSGLAILPGIEEADLLGRIGAVTEEGMLRIDPGEQMNSVLIALAPGASREAVEAVVEPFGVSVGTGDTPAELVNLRRVDRAPYAVAAIVGLLAVLSIAHLVLTAARRHRFDFAVLRAFGATRRWLRSVVHWQATAMAGSPWCSPCRWGSRSGRSSTGPTPSGSAPGPTPPYPSSGSPGRRGAPPGHQPRGGAGGPLGQPARGGPPPRPRGRRRSLAVGSPRG